jgi:hypothetical protein
MAIKIHHLRPAPGAKTAKTRVGRGEGGAKGKTAGKLHEYGMADFAPTAGPGSECPLGDVCNKNIRTDGLALWEASAGPGILTQFDGVFFATAGHDESSTWQEFGEMKFADRDDVPDAFGPPRDPGDNTTLANWATTRSFAG